jgi:type IV pilus assembly protein PilW
MVNKHHSSRHPEAGFGLVEIMVGLAIGLIVTLVIMQVMVNFEGQKRTTSGNGDAQTNGSLALYAIQQQVQMAGFGLPVYSQKNQPLNCALDTAYDHDGDEATEPIGLYPMSVIDGGASGGSDTLIVRAGSSLAGGNPMNVTAVIGEIIKVDNNLGCKQNDVIVASNGTICAMSRITEPAEADTTQVTLASGADIAAGGTLACLGDWQETVYAVDKGNLVESRNGGTATPRVFGIVNIQVQYGISASATSNQVTEWVDPAGVTWGTSATTPAIEDRKRIKALRIAVVARNGLYEKTPVTQACTTDKGVINNGPCAWNDSEVSAAPKIDLSGDSDWEHYRYRVFETIVPLRNVLWSRNVL